MKNVYRKIKEIRELKGYKQKELAEYLGLEQSSYNKIENGKTALTIENLQKIADFLGVSVKEILFEETSSQTDIEKDRKIRELENQIKYLELEIEAKKSMPILIMLENSDKYDIFLGCLSKFIEQKEPFERIEKAFYEIMNYPMNHKILQEYISFSGINPLKIQMKTKWTPEQNNPTPKE